MKRVVLYTLSFLIAVLAVCVVIVCVVPYNPNGFVRAQGDKLAKLADPHRPASVVLLGGSSVAFGYDSKIIEAETGLPVINAGLHASLGMKAVLDQAAPLLRPGDVLALIPEIDQFFDNLPYGEQELADWMIISGFKGASQLNVQQWWGIAKNFPAHLKRRLLYAFYSKTGKLQPTIYRRDAFNEYGDLTAHWQDTETRYVFVNSYSRMYEWNKEFFGEYMQKLDSLQARGIRVLMIPTPIARSEYEYWNQQFDLAFANVVSSRHPYAVSPGDYILPDTLFYDTSYHLRHPGAVILSQRLSKLINDSIIGVKSDTAIEPANGSLSKTISTPKR